MKPPPCRHCAENSLVRIPRHLWMRVVPGSARFLCPDCRRTYLQVLGRLLPLRASADANAPPRGDRHRPRR